MMQIFRSTPDPGAATAPSQTFAVLYERLTGLIANLLFPGYAVILWVRHVTTTSTPPTWSYRTLVNNRTTWLLTSLRGYYLPPLPAKDSEWAIPQDAMAAKFAAAHADGSCALKVVAIQPLEDQDIVGPAKHHRVVPKVIPGFLLSPSGSKGTSDDSRAPGEQIILHLHGGGYIRGHPLGTDMLLDLSKATGLRLLSVNYRKCLSEDTAFPAPLLDAAAAYNYLTGTLGFDASSITLLGDSAGGHLVLALARYLSLLKKSIPTRIFLLSPWSDMTASFPSYRYNAKYDYLVPHRLARAARSAMRWYTPSFVQSVWMSPALSKAEDWDWLRTSGASVYVHLGEWELFKDEIIALYELMKGAGVQVRLREEPKSLHTCAVGDLRCRGIFIKDFIEIMDGNRQ